MFEYVLKVLLFICGFQLYQFFMRVLVIQCK